MSMGVVLTSIYALAYNFIETTCIRLAHILNIYKNITKALLCFLI